MCGGTIYIYIRCSDIAHKTQTIYIYDQRKSSRKFNDCLTSIMLYMMHYKEVEIVIIVIMTNTSQLEVDINININRNVSIMMFSR